MKPSTSPRKRTLNTTVACPFIYGNYLLQIIEVHLVLSTLGSLAFYLGKKADQFATHRWTLYVRSPNGEDLSTFIQKVAFTLHPSFAQPVRGNNINFLTYFNKFVAEVLAPPYEVTETGWGEFEAGKLFRRYYNCLHH